MKREHWVFPDSNLILEKYAKVINLEHFERLDGSLSRSVRRDAEILHLVDLSHATLINLSYGDISHLYNDYLTRIGEIHSLKLAIYSGENSKNDFMKISAFSKYDNERFQIKNFVELMDALKWLSPTQKDSNQIWSKIKE